MDDRLGDGPPYGTVGTLIAFTRRGNEYAPYVRGRLVLAGLGDPRAPASDYLDALYAIVADAPHDVLKELAKQITIAGAKLAPDRDTWGLLPEHQALAGAMKPAAEIPRLPRGDRAD